MIQSSRHYPFEIIWKEIAFPEPYVRVEFVEELGRGSFAAPALVSAYDARGNKNQFVVKVLAPSWKQSRIKLH